MTKRGENVEKSHFQGAIYSNAKKVFQPLRSLVGMIHKAFGMDLGSKKELKEQKLASLPIFTWIYENFTVICEIDKGMNFDCIETEIGLAET